MNALKTIRSLLQATQAELGDAIGVTQGNVSFYERGQTIPPDVAGRILEFARSRGFPLTYDHLYGGTALPTKQAAEPSQAKPCLAKPCRPDCLTGECAQRGVCVRLERVHPVEAGDVDGKV